jgi:hypothetical protein
MMMLGPLLLIGLYLALIAFGIWIGYTLVMAVVRISHSMERASSSLAEIARNQAGKGNPPS